MPQFSELWTSGLMPRSHKHLLSIGSMILLLFCFATVEAAVPKQKAMIAVLLPDDNSRPFSTHRLRPAMDIAVEKVTAPGGILHGHAMEISYRDSNCSSGQAMNNAINLYYGDKAHVFLGPICDYAAAPVARQCKYWNTPIITAVQARDFTSDKTTFPTVTRIGSNFYKLSEFIDTIDGRVVDMSHPSAFLNIPDQSLYVKTNDKREVCLETIAFGSGICGDKEQYCFLTFDDANMRF
ncbi:Atrial natriuretic peptide receptor 3-like [Plakobranchus ocellatus]|uniref:Atrial natriuretic peptide receptor 3-like n=1 Tax=Plakobranchus ocellatus TaxID=259542 RepID=A0AAV4DGE8_9GAST|nr:Atrial natriuretic peptide receptor 3-like [Plakobranchus ocellatus]